MSRRLAGLRVMAYALTVFAASCAATGLYLRGILGSAAAPGSLAARLEVMRFECEVAAHQNRELEHEIEHVADSIRTVERQIEIEREQAERLRVARADFLAHRDLCRSWQSALANTKREVGQELDAGPFGHAVLAERHDDAGQERAEVIGGLEAAIDAAKLRLEREEMLHKQRMEQKRRLRDQLRTRYEQIVADLQVAARMPRKFR